MVPLYLYEASFHPPDLDATAGDDGEEEGIPSVLLEFKAYVADRRNGTTAYAYSRCGREVQVTLFAARPPRVSHLCVFCRPAATTEEHQQMIAMEPQVRSSPRTTITSSSSASPSALKTT
jgi:hypothetical protein